MKNILMLIFCSAFLSVQAQQKPAMYYTDTASGSPIAKDPSVVFFKGNYWMYYSVAGNETQGWSIGIAQSNDMVHWKKVGHLKGKKAYEKNGICAPGALVKDGKLHLFYQTYGNGDKDAICNAYSKDGIHFIRNKTNPIFHPTGNWNNHRAIDAEVVLFKNHYFLYFATRDPKGKTQKIGVAKAPLKTDFKRTDWKQLSDRAILAPILRWEGNCTEAPSILKKNGKLYMFYAGSYNNAPQQIGVAVSQDGISWERLFKAPFLNNGAPGSWNSSESGHPDIFEDREGKTHLFFQGNNTNGKSWYLSQKKIFWNNGQPKIKTTN